MNLRHLYQTDHIGKHLIDEIKNMDIRVFLLFQRLIHEDSTIELINNSRLDIDDLDISDILKISQD